MAQRPTLYATNSTVSQLAEQLAESTISRILSTSEQREVTGPDLRPPPLPK
jgi:hypothetical protein